MEPLSLDRLLLFAACVGNERDTPAGKRRASWEKSFRRSREDEGQNVTDHQVAISDRPLLIRAPIATLVHPFILPHSCGVVATGHRQFVQVN